MRRYAAALALALCATGCGSELREWFAAGQSRLKAQPYPEGPIYATVLEDGPLADECRAELRSQLTASTRLKQASSPTEAKILLEIEPVDAYGGDDGAIAWAAVVFRVRASLAGEKESLVLEGPVAAYKAQAKADWPKLLREGLRKASIREGIAQVVRQLEAKLQAPEQPKTSAPAEAGKPPEPSRPEAVPPAAPGSAAEPAAAPAGSAAEPATAPPGAEPVAPEPAAPQAPEPAASGSVGEAQAPTRAAEPLRPSTKTPSPHGGKAPSPH